MRMIHRQPQSLPLFHMFCFTSLIKLKHPMPERGKRQLDREKFLGRTRKIFCTPPLFRRCMASTRPDTSGREEYIELLLHRYCTGASITARKDKTP